MDKNINIKNCVEEFSELYSQKQQEWFEKHFANKPFSEAMFESLKSSIVLLMCTMCKFMFLKESLRSLKTNKEYYKTLSKDDKTSLKDVTAGVDVVIKELDNILNPIAEGILS